METVDSFRHFVQSCPHIDGHAHNLLKSNVACELSSLSTASEPSDDTLIHRNRPSLSSLRAFNNISELYGLSRCSPSEQQLNDTHKQLVRQDYEGLIRTCLKGTHTLILDASLPLDSEVDSEDQEPYNWHDQFTTSPTSRVLRIETMAESLLVDIMSENRVANESVWSLFRRRFREALSTAIQDTSIVAFTTDICSRTGLDIDPHTAGDDILTASLYRTLDLGTRSSGYYIEDKPLNEWLVQQTLNIPRAKPLQFHGGWSKEPSTVPNRLYSLPAPKPTPALLEPLIANHSDGPKIVLSLAYPYARDAAYLASYYRNVYLDLGEVFPRVSREGQENFLRECLEVAPTTQLLWSSNGIWQPESFWLANKQFRQALETVRLKAHGGSYMLLNNDSDIGSC
ncbi:Amidohydrolase 2 [Penicillium taxi]|uniref:Amidohydrolase 2 n=1 Tax=Penicillium taxi TaxID=168475 RepID=UPI0025455172|nr:Amidohydrolase 2 [Penicillium taxi]KAJ5885069.1 Amidohydrolase 2 [Penicillium taxi]